MIQNVEVITHLQVLYQNHNQGRDNYKAVIARVGVL